jgi:hypothetical protein
MVPLLQEIGEFSHRCPLPIWTALDREENLMLLRSQTGLFASSFGEP